MHVVVDHLKCTTAGICVAALPQVFRFREGSKKAMVIMEEIPPELQQQCRQVAQQCPSDAIRIIE